jgi:Ser/Thr protein kinase RdoA (MazF antagonist)
MRRLAAQGLADYDLPPARLSLIAHRHNTLFRVDTPDGERYVLRLHRQGAPNVEKVSSELAWLAALRRDTALEVPAPVATRGGQLLSLVADAGLPQPSIGVLFRWLPGRRLRHGLTPRALEQVGELMARLQNHAAGWHRPPDFVRNRVDWPVASARALPDPFVPPVISGLHSLAAAWLSPADAGQVAAVLTRLQSAQQALGRGLDAYGLMHADLHHRNLLFDHGRLRPIDFDDCGFGLLLFDPAVMLSEILDWPNYPALRAGLLAGYRRARPLPPEHEAYLDLFIALRRIQDIDWPLSVTSAPPSPAWFARARRSLRPVAALLGDS